MSDVPADPTAFHGTVRLFPLPNLVLFPQVVQGLHIFEPRYRQMIADALAGDQHLALVLLQPDWERQYDERPAICAVACRGRVIQCEKLPDGRYNLRFQGTSRVRIVGEPPTDRLYRLARVEPVPDRPPADIATATRHRADLAAAVLPCFPADGPAQRQLRELFAGDSTLGQLTDLLGYALPLPLEVKQQLLEEPDVPTRAAVIIAALRVRSATAERKFPPDFSAN